jgi:hypothetical protein
MPALPMLGAMEMLPELYKDIVNTASIAAESGGMNMIEWALSLLASAPNKVMGVLSKITGISMDNLLNDENIGIDGLVDIIAAWIEVNDVAGFTNTIRKIRAATASLMGQKTGTQGSSAAASQSGSQSGSFSAITTLAKLLAYSAPESAKRTAQAKTQPNQANQAKAAAEAQADSQTK